MPGTLGVVASAEDVLNDAVLWLDAGRSQVVGGQLTNLGKGGSALNAQFGSSTGSDTNDPTLLTHTGTNYLYRPGGTATNWVSTPDLAAYTPTSSISYRFAVTADDWTPATQGYFGGHYEGTGSQRSSLCGIATSGLPVMLLSADGITANTISSSVAPTVSDGAPLLIRYDWLAAGPTVRFFTKSFNAATAYADCVDDTGWTQLGADRTTSVPATLLNSTAPMYVAGHSAGILDGRSYATAVKVDGTLQVGVNFMTGITSGGQTTFTESSANAATVTINRATTGRKSVAVTRNVLLFGTDDYLQVPDDALLDFGAGESFTVFAAIRGFGTFQTALPNFLNKAPAAGLAAAKGWSLRANVTTNTLRADIGDGTTRVTATGSANLLTGSPLQRVAVVVNHGAGQMQNYLNGVADGSAASISTVGDKANALPVRSGSPSDAVSGNNDFELVAAAVWRRVLSVNELATIAARYA